MGFRINKYCAPNNSNNSAHISMFQQSWALNTALATSTAWGSGTLASTARAPAPAPARRRGTCSAAGLSTTRYFSCSYIFWTHLFLGESQGVSE